MGNPPICSCAPPWPAGEIGNKFGEGPRNRVGGAIRPEQDDTINREAAQFRQKRFAVGLPEDDSLAIQQQTLVPAARARCLSVSMFRQWQSDANASMLSVMRGASLHWVEDQISEISSAWRPPELLAREWLAGIRLSPGFRMPTTAMVQQLPFPPPEP